MGMGTGHGTGSESPLPSLDDFLRMQHTEQLIPSKCAEREAKMALRRAAREDACDDACNSVERLARLQHAARKHPSYALRAHRAMQTERSWRLKVRKEIAGLLGAMVSNVEARVTQARPVLDDDETEQAINDAVWTRRKALHTQLVAEEAERAAMFAEEELTRLAEERANLFVERVPTLLQGLAWVHALSADNTRHQMKHLVRDPA